MNAGKVVTTHEQRLNYNGWIGEGYIIFDPTTGAGAYKIAGGGNGGLFGPQSTISLIFSYMGIFLDISAEKTLSENMKSMLRGISKVMGGVGQAINFIFDAFDLFERCGGLSSMAFWLMMTLNIAAIAGLAFVTISTGGLMGVALNSILQSVLSLVKYFVYGIVENDVGCSSK